MAAAPRDTSRRGHCIGRTATGPAQQVYLLLVLLLLLLLLLLSSAAAAAVAVAVIVAATGCCHCACLSCSLANRLASLLLHGR